ncbi:MAG TPA: hypothetical protein VHM19_10550 [Polyangiales bacterium]|jgi:hypothetical protein|nr:hypothetical protein [Polyangiales bacterium]
MLLQASASPLAAQSDPVRDASARALFEEGVSFAEKSQWEQAEDRFRRAYALRTSPIIGYNLASSLSERGKLIEASELLRKLAQDPGLDPELARSVETLSKDLGPRLARLTVHVEGTQPGDAVRCDAEPLVDAQLGVGIPMDPGWHRVVLARAGRELDAQDVQLTEGGTAELTLHAEKAVLPEHVAAAAAAPAAPQPSAAAQPGPTAATQSEAHASKGGSGWWLLAAGGAVAVATAVVIVIVASSSSSGTSAAKAKDGYQGDFNPPALGVKLK